MPKNIAHCCDPKAEPRRARPKLFVPCVFRSRIPHRRSPDKAPGRAAEAGTLLGKTMTS